MSKRIFDILSSLIVLILLSPLMLVLIVLISVESKGGPFYGQTRVGKNGKHFRLYKFRSMYVGSDKKGEITVGKDKRVTGTGKFLRKTKLDELPQLLNILVGQMSVVGPRPEVPAYVQHYNDKQKKVLDVRPGLTDIASLEYINEQEILGKSKDPESTYLNEIMPAKLKLNLEYIQKRSFLFDLKLIFKTIGRIFQ